MADAAKEYKKCQYDYLDCDQEPQLSKCIKHHQWAIEFQEIDKLN